MKKIVVQTNVGREIMIINTALITFLDKFNEGGTKVHFIGGESLSFSPDIDIMDVYLLLFYDGDYLRVGNATSEEMYEIPDVPGVGTTDK